MILNPSAALILDRAAVYKKNNVFVLGCYAKRVTFHAQQNRALNLIWALFESGKISPDSRIGIIGAGLAGITAAVAAKSKGCAVDLYETSDQIMHIQRGNWTRYIHPNIYDWPRPGCEKDFTELPFLNWKADVTDIVIRQIEAEWEKYNTDITFKNGHRVTNISEDNGIPRITVEDPFFDEPYNCVIVAVGFGKEKTTDFLKPRSYWSSDDLHQTMTAEKLPQEFLISGCGDGGLIDTLRLSIKDFRHETFTNDFLSDRTLDSLCNELINIEDKIPGIATDVSRFIFDEYKKLLIPEDLLKKIKRKLRNDTKLKIIGTTSTPFTQNASLLNRFAVFLLYKLGKISYQQAKFVGAESKKQNYAVSLLSHDSSVINDFDQIVLRHGPNPTVNNLVTKHEGRENVLDTETAHKLWADGFYQIEVKPEPTPFEKAEMHKASLFERLNKSKNIKNIGLAIGGTTIDPIYFVSYIGELKQGFKNLKEWKGVPVVFFEAPIFTASMDESNELQRSGKRLPISKLTVGFGIRNKTTRGGLGTLGCFVSLPNGITGILSTNHVLAGRFDPKRRTKNENEEPLSGKIYAVDKENNIDFEIGKLYKVIPIMHMTDPKGTRLVTSLSDAAVAKLNSGVQFSPLFDLYGEQLSITEAADPLPGLSVYKIGAGSGLTNGLIHSVSGTYLIASKGKEKFAVNDAFIVEGDNDEFSTGGDSGALVFDSSGNAYGIVMANSGKFTLVCPLKPILAGLECRLYPSESSRQ